MKQHNANIIYKLFLLLFCIAWHTTYIHAGNPEEEYHNNQVEVRSFDKDSLDFYKKTLKYPDLSEQPEESDDLENISIGDFWLTLVKVAFFLLLAFLIGFIIYKVSDNNRPSSKTKKVVQQSREIELEEIRENLHETDLQQLIKQAIASGDYQHAASLYYLEALKRLSEKSLIVWRKAKTNAEYLRELNGLDIAPQFRKLTHIFESIFYGEKQVTATEFQQLQPLFENMLQSIAKTLASNE